MPTTQDGLDTLQASVHRKASDIQDLRETWQALAQRTPGLAPWQQWEFAASWWPSVGMHPGGRNLRELRLILVRDQHGPVLLLPLQLSRRGRAGMRWLEPLGMPDEIHRPRLGLGAPDAAAYEYALREIVSRRAEWDGIRIDEKVTDDAELALLRPCMDRTGLRERRARLHPCPYLAIDQDWSRYLASRSSRLRKNLGSGLRKLQALGEVQLRSYRHPDEIREAVEILIQVTSRSWKSAAGIGLGSGEKYRDYFRDFADRMARTGEARAWCLFSGGRPVAATLAFTRGRTYYSCQIAHDREFDTCSPGTLLESMEMQALHEERSFEVYDFLGAALANKRRWTDTMDETLRILWLGNSLRARVFDAVYFLLKPALAAARSRLSRSATRSPPARP